MQQTTLHPSLSTTCIDALKTAVLQKYGQDGLAVLEQYNPDSIFRKQMTADECFFGKYPTLGGLRAQYDSRFPSAWLMAHLYDLSEYCGCKDKLEGKALQQCASVIASEFSYLKISELMLFFHRFKSGRYGRFYGSVDPLVITTSIRDFIRERAVEYERRNIEEERRKEDERRKEAVSWEDYCMMTYGEIRPHPLAINKKRD